MEAIHTFKSELDSKSLIILRGIYPNRPRRNFVVVNTDMGYPYAHISVNTDSVNLEENEVAIKTWGFNKGISEEVFDTGIFERTGKKFVSGYAVGEVWRFK